MNSRSWRLPRFLAPLAILLMLATLVPSSGTAAASAGAGFHPLLSTVRRGPRVANHGAVTPPTDAQCRAMAPNVPCYSPQEMQKAYGEDTLLAAGNTGKGETIVIIDSYGSPTIQADLSAFDAGYGLPDPPSFQVIAPLGTVPWNPNDSTMLNWGFETTLDVEWSHAMAPGANIVLLTSPVAETEGVAGMPQFADLIQYALDHHLGQVISQSWGATEETLASPAGQAVLQRFETLYQRAASEKVTVFASAGDSGPANQLNPAGTIYSTYPTVIYPAASPWVTAVGGTSLNADTTGAYQSEVVWNDNYVSNPNCIQAVAGGGGVSRQLAEPTWQKNLPGPYQLALRGHRAIPDISYNADPCTSILVYLSFPGATAGFYYIGGTSEGSPQWAGLIAVADQMAGHAIGFINPSLYALGQSRSYATSEHDILYGNTTNMGVPGYVAAGKWDIASGWGSPIASSLLPALAAAHSPGTDQH